MTTILARQTPSSKSFSRRRPLPYVYHSRPRIRGMVTSHSIRIGMLIDVHVLDEQGKELYAQRYRLTGLPYINDLGLEVVNTEEGLYNRAFMNTIRGISKEARGVPTSLWELGIGVRMCRGAPVWNARRYAQPYVPPFF